MPPAPVTKAAGALLGLWDIRVGQVSKKYEALLSVTWMWCSAPGGRGPLEKKILQRETLGIDDVSGRYDCDGAGLWGGGGGEGEGGGYVYVQCLLQLKSGLRETRNGGEIGGGGGAGEFGGGAG